MLSVTDEIKSKLTIPSYFKSDINQSIDLTKPFIGKDGTSYRPGMIPCPFHKEDTPSFSYDARRGIWRCFGKCHCGGDVIRLHQVNRHLVSYDKATDELAKRLHIDITAVDFNEVELYVDVKLAKLKSLQVQAESYATNINDVIELDYIRTKYVSVEEQTADLIQFILVRQGVEANV